MWEYKDSEYVKLFRKMTEWEWYTDVNTKVLFLHCLIKANWKAGSWHGYKYERGQFITSIHTLAHETGLTERQVRTALNHLKATGEVTDWHDNRIRMITVVSYDRYQGERQANGQSDDSQTTGKRQASDSRYKNIKNNKEGEEGGGYTSPTAPPSLDEVKAECRLQKYDAVNPDVFYSYYQARHWRLGGEPIDWRAMLRHWDLKDAGNGDKPAKKKPISADEIGDIVKDVFERRNAK
jgi:hypothetical protein